MSAMDHVTSRDGSGETKRDVFQSRLRLIGECSAVVGVVLYAIGFAVVSVHHARFGILEFGLLRSRILSAGFLFAIFFLVPSLEVSSLWGLWGFPVVSGTARKDEPFNARKIPTILVFTVHALMFVALTVAIFNFIGPIFFDDYLSSGMSTASVGLLLPSLTIAVLVARFGSRHPVVFCVAVAATFGWIAFSLYRWASSTLSLFIAWCCLSAYAAYYVEQSRKKRRAEWAQSVMLVFGLEGFFAFSIYPRIRSVALGGAPVPATFRFGDRSPLDTESGGTQLWLLDETGEGFYALRQKNDGKAIFIPRSIVTAIWFGNVTSQPKSTSPSN